MEGGGEGMVAIIQGLQDAGLAVTLMNREQPSNLASIYAPRSPISLSSPLSPAPTLLTEGTSTNVPITTDISSQMCNDRYTSSYQLAHCRQRPSSPPVLLREFPLRKSDASRNLGNFNLGSGRYGSGKRPASSFRAAGTRSPYRSSFTYPDRETPTLDTRASEAFAASLRKYSLSPERTPSAEFVCKLLSYTQNKNNAVAKAVRSLLKEKVEEKQKCSDKDVQTYTRARPKTKESIAEELNTKSVKRMRAHSPVKKDGRVKRYKDSQLNETYDYLKSTTPQFYSRPEVRYLNDMSKCIKETIKQIIDDGSKVESCCQMRKRYLEHKKRCQARSSKQIGESSHTQGQACQDVPEANVEKDFEKKNNTETSIPTCPSVPPRCYCLSEISPKVSQEFDQKVSEIVHKWLHDIPAFVNMSAADKQKRIDMTENLANTIIALKDDDDIKEKTRQEIENCLNSLPMWLPSTHSDADDLKRIMTDALMDKLEEVFEGADKFHNEITKWIDHVKFKSKDSLGQAVDKDKITDMLTERLKYFAINNSEDNDDYDEDLKNEIKDILDGLPIEVVGKKEQFINKLANRLTNTIKNIPASDFKPSKVVTFDDKITQIIDDIKFKKRDSQGNLINKKQIGQNFSERLKSLVRNRQEDDDSYYEVLKNDVTDILGELPIEIVGNREQFIEKLASKITNTIRNISASDIEPSKENTVDKFSDKISELINVIKFKKRDSQGKVVNKQQIADTISERLKSIALNRQEHDDYHDEALKNEITDILGELPIEVVGNKEQFINKLANKLTNTIKRIPDSDIKPSIANTPDNFNTEISKIIGGMKFKTRDSQGKVINKQQIAEKLTEKLNSLALATPEDFDDDYHEALKHELTNILKVLPIEANGNKEQYVDKLANHISNIIEQIYVTDIERSNENTTDKFSDKISELINVIKFKKRDSQGKVVNKQQIADTISGRLKSIALNRQEHDDYHEALKNEITDILGELPIEVVGNKEQFINKLANKLTNTIKRIPDSDIKPSIANTPDNFNTEISKIIGGMKFKTRDSQGKVINKQQIAEKLTEKLNSLALATPEDFDDDYHEALKHELTNILKVLPIEANGNKEQYIDKLANHISNIIEQIYVTDIERSNENTTDKFSDKILQLIDGIKLKKRDSHGKVVNKQQIVDSFADRLKSLALDRPEDDDEYHEVLKNEITDILEGLPMEFSGKKKQYIDKLANKLTNTIKKISVSDVKSSKQKPTEEFEELISQLINDIKFRKKDSQGNVVNKQEIADIFEEKLKSLALDRPEDDDDYYKNIKTEIVDMLEELPIEVVGNKEQFLDTLANNITNAIQKIPRNEIKTSLGQTADKFKDKILQLIKNIKLKKKDSQGNIVNKQRIADTFAERLKTLALDRPDDDDDYHDVLKNEIADMVEELPIEVVGNKEQFMDNLANNITNTVQKIPPNDIKASLGQTTDKFKNKISQLINNIKMKKKDGQGNIVNKQQIADTLAERLKILALDRPDDDDDYHDVLKNEIADMLEALPIEVVGNRAQFIDNLANNITNTVQKIPPNDIKASLGQTTDKFKNKISQLINNIKMKKNDGQGNIVNKQQIADTFAERLKTLALDRPDDDDDYHDVLKNEIADMLEELPIEVVGNKKQFIDSLANNITNTVQKIPRNDKKASLGPTTDKFKNKISQVINNIKMKKKDGQGNIVNKQQIADTFAERLKTLTLDRPDDDDDYHDVLKNEIADMLEALPIEVVGNKEQFIDNIANNITNTVQKIPPNDIKASLGQTTDKFKNIISELINNIQMKKKDGQGNIVNKQQIADTFAERLKTLALDRPDDNDDYYDVLKNEIADMLEELPIEVMGNKEQFIDNLANNITNTVQKIPTNDIKASLGQTTDKFKNKISQLINNIKMKKKDGQGNIVNKQQIADTFAERLKTLALDRPDDDDDYYDVLKNEIADMLEELPIEVMENKEQFIDNLANNITNTVQKMPPNDIKASLGQTTDKFKNKISQLINNIKMKKKDGQGNIVNKQQIADTFAERLKTLALDRPDDDDDYHDVLKNEIADMLEALPIEVVGNKAQFIDNLANNITNTVQKIPPNDIKASLGQTTDNFKYKISQLIDDIKFKKRDSQGKVVSKQQIADTFAKRLKSLAMDRPNNDDDYHETLKNEITDILQGLPLEVAGNKEQFIDKLANKLTNAIKIIPRTDISQKQNLINTLENSILSWLKNDPELSVIANVDDKEIKKTVKKFAKKLQAMQSKGLSNDDINDEVNDWMQEALIKGGYSIDTETKHKLAEKLRMKLNTLIYNGEIKTDKESLTAEIVDWLKDIPELSIGSMSQNNKTIEGLVKQLQQLKPASFEYEDEIQKVVMNWLSTECEEKGTQIDYTTMEKLANKLAKTISNTVQKQRRHSAGSPESSDAFEDKVYIEIWKFGTIANELSHIIDSSTLAFSLKEKRNVIRRVASCLSRNINNVSPSDVENVKANVMDILDQETNLPTEKVKELAEAFISSAKYISALRRGSSADSHSGGMKRMSAVSRTSSLKPEVPDNVRDIIRENVKKSLRTFNISNPDEIETMLCGLLTEQVLNGVSTDITNKKIMGILQSTNLSEEDAKDLTMRLTSQTLDLSSIRDTTMPSDFTATEKEQFQTSAINNITNFMDEIDANVDPNYRRKIKTAAQKLAKRLGEEISDPNKTIEDKDDLLNTEISNFLKSFSISVDEYGPRLANQLRNLAATSTPRQLVPNYSFCPRRSSFSTEFKYNLEKNIRDWIVRLSLHIGDKTLIDNIVRDLACDIADRQKYLQSHPTIRPTEKEELEFLKYQVFRAMGKLVEGKELATIMDQTVSLLNEIKGQIKSMQAKSPSSQGPSAQSMYQESIFGDQIQQETSQFLEENLLTGILDWLRSLPLYQRRISSEKRILEEIVQDIVKNIKEIIETGLIGNNLDMQILQIAKKHLEKLPMEEQLKSNKAYVEKVAAQLVDYLNNMQLFQNISTRQTVQPLEYLISTINDWIKSLPIASLNPDTSEVEKTKMEFLDRLTQILKDASKENDQTLKYEIKRFLETLYIYANKALDTKFISRKIDELFTNILGTPFMSKPSRPTISRDLVESAVRDWSGKLPYSPGKTQQHVSDKIQNFAADISSVLQDAKVSAVDNYKNNLLDKTLNLLKQLPIELNNLSSEKSKGLAEDLLNTIKDKVADLTTKPESKKAADVLYNNIATWCDDLPLFEGNTPEEKERVNTIKQNLASRLVNKIAELNMNPGIFNDDFLYEHLIQEEIDDLLGSLPRTAEFENNYESIKENLTSKVKEAKQKTKDELAGQTYMQQLRETISKSLPFDTSLSSEGAETFEVLVDKLADAYVDLNFVNNNEEQKAKYKTKIADEITKYCNSYLKRYPEPPLDSIKINQDLYNALKNVTVPKEEIMKSEAEHIRIKDVVNDWMNELPLTKKSGLEKIPKNKMASVLAEKLLEIEREKKLKPDIDYEEKTRNKIHALLKKLPLAPGHEVKIDEMIQRLTDKLKSTEQSRRISDSTIRRSIDLSPQQSVVIDSSTQESAVSSEEQFCPYHRRQIQRLTPCKNNCNYKPNIPKSTLTTEDRAHLDRIRMRNSLAGCQFHHLCNSKDAFVNPPPIDATSQTDTGMQSNISNICTRLPRTSSCPADSQTEVSPQIIIKEYLWDSGTSKLLGPVYRLPCVEVDAPVSSRPSLQRPLQKSVCIQPSPCLISQPSPCASPHQIPPRPCINLRSPCPSPQQLSNFKPCNLTRPVLPTQPPNICSTHRSVNTIPCEPTSQCSSREVPYCSTPRRPVLRDQNIPFRQPCFQRSFSKTFTPVDADDGGPSSGFPRVTNLGSFDDKPKSPCRNPCQRRVIQNDDRLSDYNDCTNVRRRVYSIPSKDPHLCDLSLERRPKCKCKSLNRNKVHPQCQTGENFKICSKCCGMPCPHPTGLFFR